MSESTPTPIAVLGLGSMGRALAAAFLKAGHPTTVWNRSPGKDGELRAAGASGAATAPEALRSAELVVVCLLDHASVREVLEPLAEDLAGKHVVNLTSTAPEESRAVAQWAADQGLAYLDGGIMAVPEMIGSEGSVVFYSGSAEAFESHRAALEPLGEARYFGEDAGSAALHDFALLAGMYVMFAGVFHGMAMVRSAGTSARDYAAMVVPWLNAMLQAVPEHAAVIDGADYTTEVQSLDFNRSGVDAIVRASRDAGVSPEVLAPVKALVDRQVAAGHGPEAFERIAEELMPARR
jgi:3-hydroxyisobutyrate dehydrogenase-like beta-hydroxyacid dehydrogenase